MRFCGVLLLLSFSLFAAERTYRVSIEVESIQGAKGYEVEAQSLNNQVKHSQISKRPEVDLQLPIGRYKVRSRASDQRGIFGVWSQFEEIVVMPSPQLKNTSQLKVSAKEEDIEGQVRLEWSEVEGISKYAIEVQEKGKTEVFKKIETKDNKLELNLPPGNYTYKIKAVAEDGLESIADGVALPIQVEGGKLKIPEVQDFDAVKGHFEWKPIPHQNVRAKIEYHPHLSSDWKMIDLLDHVESPWRFEPKKNGVYRIQFWSEAPGWEKSIVITKEFVLKPKDL